MGSRLSLGALVAIGLWLLNPLFQVLARAKAREVMTAAALLVVLGVALLMESAAFQWRWGLSLLVCCCRKPTQ